MSGEILFLAHRNPYPPDRGDKIRSWHLLRHIAKIAPTHVVALYDDARDLVHLPLLEGVAASVALARSGVGEQVDVVTAAWFPRRVARSACATATGCITPRAPPCRRCC